MTDYWTGDDHFQHANILRYCNRPFKNIWEHDEALIDNWNQTVKNPKDRVFHHGDFGFGSPRSMANIIRRLNGQIYWIKGNHDKSIKGEVLELPNFHPVGIYHTITVKTPKCNKQLIVMCHYPFETWNRSHFGTICTYGHCHGNLTHIIPNRLDVGVDCHGYKPISLEEILEILEKRDRK